MAVHSGSYTTGSSSRTPTITSMPTNQLPTANCLQYDHALHLYPLPHAVVVADSSPQAQHTHQGCTVINPVSHHLG